MKAIERKKRRVEAKSSERIEARDARTERSETERIDWRREGAEHGGVCIRRSGCTHCMLNIKAASRRPENVTERGATWRGVAWRGAARRMPTPSCMEESFALVLPTEGSLAPPPVAGCT